LIWSDEFDGDALDTTKWTIVAGDGCAAGLCGWGNDELETYAASNVRVADGALTLEARRGAAGYTSAKIVSRGKADFGLAAGTAGVDEDGARGSSDASRRFEARLQLPWGRGIWPAFWMLPTDDTFGGWPEVGADGGAGPRGRVAPDSRVRASTATLSAQRLLVR
jgi:beta-glucanase (GH16 family)